MRFPFFRAKTEAEPLRPAPKRAERARGPAPEAGLAEANAARTRARQRLVGALVLLLVGVVGFPVLFETQPRPLPLDIPIQVGERPAGEAPPLAGTVRRPLPVTSLPADAGSEVVPTPQVAASTAPSATAPASPSGLSPVMTPVMPPVNPAPAPAAPAPRPSAPVVAAAPPPKAAASAPARPVVSAPASAPAAATAAASARAEGARASALLAGGRAAAASASAPAPATGGRFVVQVGAYTDARTLKEARGKVEKLGLQTYTQVIEGDAGKRTRVRLGPYATRAEAEAAADKLKRAGLPANILAL